MFCTRVAVVAVAVEEGAKGDEERALWIYSIESSAELIAESCPQKMMLGELTHRRNAKVNKITQSFYLNFLFLLFERGWGWGGW